MSEYIKHQTPIDIALDKEKEHLYSGICLKENRYVFIIVNFNEDTKEFDGVTVFRNKDVLAYLEWDEEDEAEIKNNNFPTFRDLIDLNKMNSFSSSLKEAAKTSLIAIFTGLYDEDYYVGELVEVNRKQAIFRLIDENKKWIGEKVFNIKDISFFGFATAYEKELLK